MARKHFLGPAAIAAALAPLTVAMAIAAPAVATASTAAKSHKVNLNGLIDTVSSKGATGSPGATATDAGILAGTVSGKSTRGAHYQYSTFGSGLTLTGNGVVFGANGSIRFYTSAKFVPASGGTFKYSGTVTVTGGTGVYKHAHRTLSTSGTTLTSDSDAATINVSGTLRY